MMVDKTCGFLAYLNRSGSTLLARLLNEYRDIGVGIEGLERRFLHQDPERFSLRNSVELDRWLDRVYRDDPKFKGWGIDRRRLRTGLLKTGFPISYHKFLETCLKIYFQGDSSRVLIHKESRYFQNLKRSAKIFPGWKYIFIDRDPRGIFNSQKKSLESITGLPMRADIVRFALNYKNQQIRIRFYRKEGQLSRWFIRVRYENILEDGKDLIRILDFFQCSDSKKAPGRPYLDRVPRDQRHLHKLVENRPLKERAIAWQKELGYDEIAFLNKVLYRELRENGYDQSYLPPEGKITNKGKFLRNMVMFYLRFFPKYHLKSLLIFFRLRRSW
jgi:hypothetical protein